MLSPEWRVPGKNTGVGCHFLLQCMKVKSQSDVTSVVSNSVRPHRWQPNRLPVPGILQARTLEWVAMSFSSAWKWKLKVKSLSRVRLFATPWTVAYQAPPSMGCSRQEYWSGVPLPSPQLRLDTAKQVFWFQLSPFCGQWGSCTCEGWLAVYMGKQ